MSHLAELRLFDPRRGTFKDDPAYREIRRFADHYNEVVNHFQLDPWHLVGDPNEPAFQNSWTNLGGNIPCGFRKDPFGNVYLKGVVTGGAENTDIFTLSEEYRPVTATFITLCAGKTNTTSDATMQLRIGTSGVVIFVDVIGVNDGTTYTYNVANGWVSLSGVVIPEGA